MTFEDCVEIILKHEGGYVRNANDPGGETNFGISKRSYPGLDIQALTKDEAKQIYKRDFWDRYNLESLPEGLRLIVFDCSVNQGPGFAVASLQSVVGAKPDGVIGPQTLAAVTGAPEALVLKKFAQRRFQAYLETKNFNRFGIGWLKRLLDVSLERQS